MHVNQQETPVAPVSGLVDKSLRRQLLHHHMGLHQGGHEFITTLKIVVSKAVRHSL